MVNLRTRTLLISGLIGATLGALAGWLYLNSHPVEVDEEGMEHIETPSATSALKLGVSMLGVMRQLTD
jgi:hypothetical protein